MKTLPTEFITAVFGRKAKSVHEMLAWTQRKHRDIFFSKEGHVFAYGMTDKEIIESGCGNLGGGNTRAIFHYIDENDKTIFRLDIPTRFFRDRGRINFWLYNIRFMIDLEKFPPETESMLPFRRGYFGVTKRDIFQRFSEHERDVRNGKGHILHSAWRALHNSGVDYFPVLQISGVSKTLDEIYALEEEAVEKVSLTPRGLNAIPGGYAGIKMLHQLALLKGNRVMPDVRDAALVQLERGKVSTHYRTGHLRKLADERLTWVSPCWVNLPKDAAA